jgi:hypothetical protein
MKLFIKCKSKIQGSRPIIIAVDHHASITLTFSDGFRVYRSWGLMDTTSGWRLCSFMPSTANFISFVPEDELPVPYPH